MRIFHPNNLSLSAGLTVGTNIHKQSLKQVGCTIFDLGKEQMDI